MQNKNIRRYLVWLGIGLTIILVGIIGNTFIEKEDAAIDATGSKQPGIGETIEQINKKELESVRNLVYARSSHSATTLKGGRILVVGGLGSDKKPMAKVEIYDPQTDTWMTMNDCLAPRADHTATVLKDGNVIVVGGTSDVGVASTAEIFYPKTGTWEYAGRMNFARQSHRATLLNDGRLLITGGKGVNKAIDAVELYNPITKTWSRAGSLNFPKYAHTATLLPDGNVLVAGGGEGFVRQVHGEIFYPESSTWRSLTTIMDIGRGGHTATVLNSQSILFVGGTQGSSQASIYNISEEKWIEGAQSEQIRDSHTATLMKDGRVLITGGGISTLSAEIYDPNTQLWTSAGDMNISRREHTATALKNGKVLIIGGQHGGQITSLVETFDPDTNRWDTYGLEGGWSDASIMSIPRKNHTSTLLPDGSVLITGGISRIDTIDDEGPTELLDSAERYFVGGIGKWTTAGRMLGKRTGHTASLLPDGRVLVIGGGSVKLKSGEQGLQELEYLKSTEMYDYKTASWIESPDMTSNRWEHTATVMENGDVLVVGGENAYDKLSSVELYRNDTKQWVSVEEMSVARARHVAVLLSNGRVLVSGGGSKTAEVYDMKINKWTEIGEIAENLNLSTAAALPSGKALMVGGYGEGGAQYQVQIYNPEFDTWSMAPKIPKPRVNASLIPLNKNLLLLAGGNQFTHSWIFDTKTMTWTKAAKMLTARTGQSAAQLAGGKVLISGGENRKGKMEATAEVYTLIAE